MEKCTYVREISKAITACRFRARSNMKADIGYGLALGRERAWHVLGGPGKTAAVPSGKTQAVSCGT
jgi:hypothetical protein